ncbi:ubiquitin-protein ligase ASR1 CYBJADRAFT_184360 [Cyberlindnera jadinii NRRL Y-1542]|uniref:RING-type E3 ubiquitin transferase n=1 Tax=Cyberlindnera jadinii (strain ATCC 18201 / CBS 1600 / BCRC 20928 / JCM 3617 / NBRC 0987 / NRRL Y-1542) TaxID=983966 RepID=A0A1E4S3G3_CYBJN|nr:hypothetical protein CYBJADRAFT_184360 [Cyberlindnera jadinii NRRL Y-1542]ODV73942.1 hypothetical protein CYBJADRAFT_184360 [Cyberlindnera jadinii NRRL Y-1542]
MPWRWNFVLMFFPHCFPLPIQPIYNKDVIRELILTQAGGFKASSAQLHSYTQIQAGTGSMEECTICLEPFGEGTRTRLQPCGHHYHTHCIDHWRSQSNHCPTCRSEFSLVQTVARGGEVVSQCRPTRVAAVPQEEFFEENEMMADDAVPRDEVQRRIERLVGIYNVCMLCDRHSGHVLSCCDCSSTFHATCLGLLSSSVHWMCPMCSSEQRQETERTSLFRRSRMSERTNRVYNMLTDYGRDTSVHVMEETVVERSSGSVDEQNAWSQFERVRRGEAGASMTSVGSSMGRKQKPPSRRGRSAKVQETQCSSTAQQCHAPPASHSLIGRIVNDMKHSSRRELVVPIGISTTTSQSPHSPQSPQSPTSSISSFQASFEEGQWKMDTTELALEQKTTLQEMVRDRLRPKFKDGTVDVHQYTEINKRVSRALYQAYLNGEVSNLEQIADEGVERELMNL